jgi:histone H3/H4
MSRYSLKIGANRLANLPVAAIIRIAKQNGAERVGSDAANALISKAEDYISRLTVEANKLALHAGRKTLKAEDIEMAVESI